MVSRRSLDTVSIKLIRSCTTFIFTRNLQKFAITRSEGTQCVPLVQLGNRGDYQVGDSPGRSTYCPESQYADLTHYIQFIRECCSS
jgi:hypothetical protein